MLDWLSKTSPNVVLYTVIAALLCVTVASCSSCERPHLFPIWHRLWHTEESAPAPEAAPVNFDAPVNPDVTALVKFRKHGPDGRQMNNAEGW